MKKFLPIAFLISFVLTIMIGLGCAAGAIGAAIGWNEFPWKLLYAGIGFFIVTSLINMFWTLRTEKK